MRMVFVRVVSHENGLSLWSLMRMVCHGGLSSEWSVMVVSHQNGLCQGGLS